MGNIIEVAGLHTASLRTPLNQSLQGQFKNLNIKAFYEILAVRCHGEIPTIINADTRAHLKRGTYNLLLITGCLLGCLNVRAEPAEGDWPLCHAALPIPDRPAIEEILQPGEIHISAEDADLEEFGVSNLTGNVEITRDSQQLSADAIRYDEPGENADLRGNVEYWDEALYFQSDVGHVEFGSDSGLFENARYVIKENRARGEASRISHEYPTTTNLDDVDYTTCDPEDNFWQLSADKITLDHTENWGSARNVVLRIKDVPVLYTPYMSFPLSDARKTGFLFPSFGSTNRNGYEMQTPFYWNIAPEMDATLTPRLLSDSGLMMMGEFRYLLDRGEGRFNAEYLPSDNEYDNEDRNLFGFVHRQEFLDTGRLFLTYNRVSDKQYFEDFGSSLAVTSTRYLQRRADALYRGRGWNLRTLVQDYQTVDSTIPLTSRPYKRLPQIRFNAFSPRLNRTFNYELRTEFSYFDRGDNDIFLNDVNGARVDLFPSISYPFYTASTFIEPKLGYRFTQYSLTDTGSLFNANPSRALPMFSLDSGAFFEREMKLFGKPYLQTLEPRLYYLYVPFEDQTDIPVFDTGLFDFSFDALFREDRFTGPDRINDANQFTLAMTTRFIDSRTGREDGYASLGQIYYLRDREVFLPNGRERDEESSPLVADVGLSVFDDWRMRGALQWDPNNNKTEKLAGFIQYSPDESKIVNVGYRMRRTTNGISASSQRTVTDIEQSEASFLWPLNHQWSVVGRWNYALPEKRTIDAFGGVQYDSCCWAFRIVGRRFLTDVDRDYSTGIFIQLELKGLAGVGQNTQEFLEENIPGYKSGF